MEKSTFFGAARERYLLLWGSNAISGLQSAVGPATTFRAEGPTLRAGPRGKETARFHDGVWHHRKTGAYFHLLWTEAATLVRLEDSATGERLVIGTFEMIGVLRNVIYADREYSRPVVSYDELSGLWTVPHHERQWPEVVLMPVPPASWPLEVFMQPSSETLARPMLTTN